MFIIENGGNAEQNITGGKINEYVVSTAYDIATATYTTSLDVSVQMLIWKIYISMMMLRLEVQLMLENYYCCWRWR